MSGSLCDIFMSALQMCENTLLNCFVRTGGNQRPGFFPGFYNSYFDQVFIVVDHLHSIQGIEPDPFAPVRESWILMNVRWGMGNVCWVARCALHLSELKVDFD